MSSIYCLMVYINYLPIGFSFFEKWDALPTKNPSGYKVRFTHVGREARKGLFQLFLIPVGFVTRWSQHKRPVVHRSGIINLCPQRLPIQKKLSSQPLTKPD